MILADDNTTLAALIAAVPATLAAIAAFVAANRTGRHVGRSNGKGTVVQMLENNILWQGEHQAQDLAVAAELRAAVAEVKGMLTAQNQGSAQVKIDLAAHDARTD